MHDDPPAGRADAPSLHPLTTTLRILGGVIYVTASIALVLALATAWTGLDPEIGFGAARFAFPFLVVALGLLVAGSAVEWARTRTWPSAGGFAAQALGLSALVVGVLALVGAFAAWNLADGNAEAEALAAAAARAGLPLALGGLVLAVVGHLLAARFGGAARAIDPVVGLLLLAGGLVAINPGSLAIGDVPEIRPFGATIDNAVGVEGVAGLDQIERFNATLRAAYRVPVVGIGQNGPGSDAFHEFKVESERAYLAVVEARWDEADARHLVLRVERYLDGEWAEVYRESVGTPARAEITLPGPGEYTLAVFAADEGGFVPEAAVEMAMSVFSAPPPDGYSALAG